MIPKNLKLSFSAALMAFTGVTNAHGWTLTLVNIKQVSIM